MQVKYLDTKPALGFGFSLSWRQAERSPWQGQGDGELWTADNSSGPPFPSC